MSIAKTQITTADILADDRPLIPIVWAASALNLGENTVYGMRKRNDFPLPIVKVGRRYLVRRVDLLAFLGLHDDRAERAAV